MFRIHRTIEAEHVVLALSGRIGTEAVGELQSLLRSEVGDHSLVLVLKDVKLVNRDAVKFPPS